VGNAFNPSGNPRRFNSRFSLTFNALSYASALEAYRNRSLVATRASGSVRKTVGRLAIYALSGELVVLFSPF
jgi:hypothetical protein